MIFNYYENSKKILETKCLTEENANRNNKYYQEIYLMRYLLNQKSKTEIFSIWKDITNGTASNFAHDNELQKTLFNNQYQKAQKLGELKQQSFCCNLYQEEIDYINSLQAPLWVRKYFLGVLVWYKSTKKKYCKVEYNAKWASRIFNQCHTGFQYKRKSDKLKQWNRECKFPIKFEIYEKLYIRFHEVKVTEENLITDNASIENFSDYFYLLKENSFVCSCCGQEMIRGDCTKRLICDSCYQLQRKKDIARNVKNFEYKRKTNQDLGPSILSGKR